MICNGCGSEKSTRIKIKYNEKGEKQECCDLCSREVFYGVPDTYFVRPYLDEHLADDNNPHGYYVTSKRNKMEIMKKLNVRESGDRIHGARREFEGNYYGSREKR